MRYLSVCSGIEAATVAWHPLGWTPVAFSEIEPFPAAVLAHHYPNVPNYGDMTKHKEWPLGPGSIDLLVGGTPCQSFSVAGLRKGISDPRGGLMLTYLEIAQRLRPRWVVWENVPGVLSSGGGRDFGSFLGALGELGYGWAYRVLDAQWCRTHGHPRAVPQRRRRVFVVGCLGDATRAAAVLFERESVQRDSAPRRAQGQGVAADAEAGFGASCVTSHDVAPCLETTCHDYSRADGFTMVGQPTWPAEVAPTLNQSARGTGAPGYSNQKLFAQGAGCLVPQPVPIQDGRGVPVMSIQGAATRTNPASGPDGVGVSQSGVAYTLEARAEVQAVAQPVPYDLFQITAPVNRQNRKPGDPCHTLARDNAAHAAVAFADAGQGQRIRPTNESSETLRATKRGPYSDYYQAMTVRRLTPRECERLQGFPTVSTKITIEACVDHQNQSVHVALKCLKWPNSVWLVGASELMAHAKTADVPFNTRQASPEPLAALHVRMHSEDELLEIHSLGRLIWSANGAGQSRKSLPPTLTEHTVQELARQLREVARTAHGGKVESPQNIGLSIPVAFGATNAEKSGREIKASVSDVVRDPNKGMFTTSALGQITNSCDSTVATSCCFALRVIGGCIPNTTLPETFSVEITIETPYTLIPWRKKPAAECPDGPRYKALGNSMACNCMAWIGERIAAVEARHD